VLLSRVGRYREAQERMRLGFEEAQRVKDAPLLVVAPSAAALVATEYGDIAAAGAWAKRAEAALPGNPPGEPGTGPRKLLALYAIGMMHVRHQQLEAARGYLQQQRSGHSPELPFENWLVQALAGEIALAAGDLAGAAEAFTKGEPPLKMPFNLSAVATTSANNSPSRDGLARVKAARGDLAGAIAEYRTLITPDMSRKWTAVLEPRYVLQLARLLERQGDLAAARREYRRFLELWRAADPGLPELAEARRKVQG
jgi:tetratricopeptide (TPR) repeat protein